MTYKYIFEIVGLSLLYAALGVVVYTQWRICRGDQGRRGACFYLGFVLTLALAGAVVFYSQILERYF